MDENMIKRELRKISRSFNKVKIDMNEIMRNQESYKTQIKGLMDKINKLEKKNKKKSKEIIVGNIESKKFHINTCPFAKNIKSDNKVIFKNIERAVKSGYHECSCIREN